MKKRPLYKYVGPRCGKTMKCKLSKKLVPCDAKLGHDFHHTACLLGLKTRSGRLIVARAPDYIAKNGRRQTKWYVEGIDDRSYFASSLLGGRSTGRFVPKESEQGCLSKKGQKKPEYSTWQNHYACIFKEYHPRNHTYVGMPFYPEWNPDNFEFRKTGYVNFENWLKSPEGIGMRPSKKHSLDIIKHHVGFWPGNLRWTLKNVQRRNQKHRTMFDLTVDQHKTALWPLGYKVIKRELNDQYK